MLIESEDADTGPVQDLRGLAGDRPEDHDRLRSRRDQRGDAAQRPGFRQVGGLGPGVQDFRDCLRAEPVLAQEAGGTAVRDPLGELAPVAQRDYDDVLTRPGRGQPPGQFQPVLGAQLQVH